MPTKHTLVFRDFDMTYEEIEHGWKMPYSHFHSHYEIYLLLSGERTVTIGGDTYTVSAGQATLFPKNVLHHSNGTTDFSGICIHFSDQFLNYYLKSHTVKELMNCFKSPVIFVPEEYRNHLLTLTKQFKPNDAGNYLLLAQILTHLNHYRTELCNNNKIPSSAKSASMSDQIMEYIQNNYTLISAVTEISIALGISDSYLYQVVKKNTSITPKKYINQLRIRHAMRELEYSNRNLPMIQETCGFHSFSYFLRVFKLETGMTPTEFRKNKVYFHPAE